MAISLPAGLGLDHPAAVAIGSDRRDGGGSVLTARTPIDGSTLAEFKQATLDDVAHAAAEAAGAFQAWRTVPPPVRGEFVRRIGSKLRDHKADLGKVVTLEAGKIVAEAEGEVQEMIDICDFAVGQSRMLYGKTIATERFEHRMMEQWHPLGPVGVISAFNFPVAVWAWNAMLAFVCGDPVVWKPSEKTPLCALACQKIVQDVIAESNDLNVPPAISSVVIGGRDVGESLAKDERFPLISATGSTRMGKEVNQVVAGRLGRCLLELGGNNAMIVTPTADLELCVRAITFSAFGTAGQRCTTLRRLIVHESVQDQLLAKLEPILGQIKIGDPREPGTLMGPLIDEQAFEAMQKTLEDARSAGSNVTGGDRATGVEGGTYAHPALVTFSRDRQGASSETDHPGHHDFVQRETFAPILYVLPYNDLTDAIAIHNGVPQGLSSAIFTGDVREAERFLSPAGSDCGIANVNIGTSGAEIGGAFGGEKETGGGRESGSDSWKAYMRRATNTINYGTDLPLAQGIDFNLGD
ncbi:MAG: aldehyde dehydrogenase family protein [Planctomycetota bacterium]